MKPTSIFLACALFAATISACDKDDSTDNSHLKDLPENIQGDFSTRYPDAKVDYYFSQNEQLEVTQITFIDRDGLSNMVYYKDGKWISNRKNITLDADSGLIPEKVYDTFSKLGIPNAQIFEHIFEDSKSGIEQKQYQFAFVGPYNFGMGEINNYANNIIIAEDGTLLSYNDYRLNDPAKIFPYDHTEFVQFAHSKYPEAKILGSTYDGRNVVVFIIDSKIVKHVIIYKDDSNKISWVKTWYPLDINTALPESAVTDKNEYSVQHPDAKLTAIRYEESSEGAYYGFTFYVTLDGGEVIYSPVK